MLPNSLQLIELKMTRLGFYLAIYLVPALLCLVQPGHWVAAVATLGLIPGLWRSLRRAQRRARLDLVETLLFSLTTAVVGVVVASVSSVLGWVSLPCWTLVAFEQAHRRERRRFLLAGSR
ncbi:hypothetical protein ABS71_11520 [bacterium SCN 62-11]|nr:hypothetical protein [Candidatus Eremiobacteraeota bacterium]ODT66733.1 MAG: hypothetical protein ABS71_11520 [bacterium SCN 62-11]